MTGRLQAGSVLLEVVVAMALMATCGLGVLSTQWSFARHSTSGATLARAAFAIDAIAEATLETGSNARDQWRTRAAALVPDGQVSVSGARVVLSWTAARDEAASGRDCSGGRACVALAFAP